MPQIVGLAAIEIFGGSAATAAFGLTAVATEALVGEVLIVGASIAYSSYEAAKARKALQGQIADQGRQIMSSDPVGPRRILYGQIRTTGTLIFTGVSGDQNQYLHRVVVIAAHEVDSMWGANINGSIDIPLADDGGGNWHGTGDYLGKFQIRYRLGGPGQIVDDSLVSAFPGIWTDQHIGTGMAYFHVTFGYDTNLWDGSENVLVNVRGKKVYDPRDMSQDRADPTTWKWSNNAALCTADYLNDKSN